MYAPQLWISALAGTFVILLTENIWLRHTKAGPKLTLWPQYDWSHVPGLCQRLSQMFRLNLHYYFLKPLVLVLAHSGFSLYCKAHHAGHTNNPKFLTAEKAWIRNDLKFRISPGTLRPTLQEWPWKIKHACCVFKQTYHSGVGWTASVGELLFTSFASH